MRVVVTHEERFERTPDGAVHLTAESTPATFDRYLRAFDAVTVLARIVDVPASTRPRAATEGVTFCAVPDFGGVAGWLVQRGAIRRAIRAEIRPDRAFLASQGFLGEALVSELRAARLPWAVEVGLDPEEVFARGAFAHPLRPVLRWHFARTLKATCADAIGALYATADTLQKRYPCPALEAAAAELAFDRPPVRAPRRFPRFPVTLTAVLGGSGSGLRDGLDVAIDAAALCVESGLDLRVVVLGAGARRPELEERARRRGIRSRARFQERRGRDAVRAELDRADLFVLAARAAGVPSLLVEAMARGLPCVATAVGGIPELVGDEELATPGDAESLARRLLELATDGERLTMLSARNVQGARALVERDHEAARASFYGHVRLTLDAISGPAEPIRGLAPAHLTRRLP